MPVIGGSLPATTPATVALRPSERRNLEDHSQRLWQLVMLELWFRQFVDGHHARPAATDPIYVQAV